MMYQATVTTNLCPGVQVSIDPLPAAAPQILSISDHRAQLRDSCDYLKYRFYYYNETSTTTIDREKSQTHEFWITQEVSGEQRTSRSCAFKVKLINFGFGMVISDALFLLPKNSSLMHEDAMPRCTLKMSPYYLPVLKTHQSGWTPLARSRVLCFQNFGSWISQGQNALPAGSGWWQADTVSQDSFHIATLRKDLKLFGGNTLVPHISIGPFDT